MCSLFSSTLPPEALVRLFAIAGPVPNLPPFDEVWPGYDAPVVLAGSQGRHVQVMRWGFLFTQKGRAAKPVGNARDDKLDGFFWRSSFQSRRCLVPVTRFAEPDLVRKWKQKHWFSVSGAEGFALAGLWRPWQGVLKGEQVEIETMAFVTTTANALVRPIHPERMPVILGPSAYDTWLTGPLDAARALIRPFAPDRMLHESDQPAQARLL